MEGKCLSCHMNLEKPFLFCSITCMCLAGYMSVRANRPCKDVQELVDNSELRKTFLSNKPLRGKRQKNYL